MKHLVVMRNECKRMNDWKGKVREGKELPLWEEKGRTRDVC